MDEDGDDRKFTPALASHEHTADYDRVIAVMTRERRWRKRLLEELCPIANEIIVDIGSGTGTFAKMVKEHCGSVHMIAVDPDPDVRKLAEAKTRDLDIDYRTGLGDEHLDPFPKRRLDAAVSSLVLHQCPDEMKRGILSNAYKLLKRGGRVLIADYGMQRSFLMHMLFKQVRELDGYENTKANKDGRIPDFMRESGFERVEEIQAFPTPTGTISIFRGWKL